MRSKAVVLALAAFPCFNALADDVRLPEVVVREKADSDRVPLHPAGDTAALLGGVPASAFNPPAASPACRSCAAWPTTASRCASTARKSLRPAATT